MPSHQNNIRSAHGGPSQTVAPVMLAGCHGQDGRLTCEPFSNHCSRICVTVPSVLTALRRGQIVHAPCARTAATLEKLRAAG
jgi:hypothetical protein